MKQSLNPNLNYYLEYFRHPHKNQKYLHIAGTKGKTSVAYYLYQMLLAQGKTVGLFISPHVFLEQERIQCNGELITLEDLNFYRSKISLAQKEISISLTFFEEILLVNFLYFQDHPVDYIILEVGIGGKLDTTNIINPVISIISRIKKDHQAILGKTLWSMFKQKLGIIKPTIPFIIGKQNILGYCYAWLLTLFKKGRVKFLPYKVLSIKGMDIIITLDNRKIQLNGPYYMVENFVLAYSTLKFLDISYSSDNFIHQVPGRLQKIPSIYNAYLDGAHNEIAIKALVKSIQLQFPNTFWKVVLCIREDKDIKSILRYLQTIAVEFIILPWEKELNNSFNPNMIIKYLENKKIAYQYILKENINKVISINDNILVTGSFYHLPLLYQQLKKDL